MEEKDVLSYSEAVALLRENLNTLDYGYLNKFCDEHDLNYSLVHKIKNNKTKKHYPNVVKAALAAFNIFVEVGKIYVFKVIKK